MRRGFVTLLFGVTRLANGQFMVQDVYLRQTDNSNPALLGIYNSAEEANMWYRYYAPQNTTVRE